MANITAEFDMWIYQLKNLVIQRFHHMAPHDYCIMLVIAIALGFVLLRGPR